VVFTQPALAGCDNRLWRLLCLLLKHVENDNGIRICPVDDTKRTGFIVDPQLMAPESHDRHRPRVWKPQRFALLQQPEQISRFEARGLGKRRRLDLAPEPDEWFVPPGFLHPRVRFPTGLYVISDMASISAQAIVPLPSGFISSFWFVWSISLIWLISLIAPNKPNKPKKLNEPDRPEKPGLRGSPQVLNPIRRDFGAGSAMSSRMASKTTRNWPSYFFSSSLRRRASPLFEAIISRS
jgi:hypothetical protein